ncbi:Crp/Fnr family transcriptional regulator [Vibrio quintilis]|uniref:Cyclic nucleotide-binding domain protein n=1 Tax=Vibrio quintilis TaxID=1117707 RepID=A0A1M7YZW2_9VIBR|nr:Crp/Fnr family transcriptional regulator [Vibrio quintilis]SHO58227.1 Cyclic nucleotide-binding domain protein [Vibrio quintilis]
MSNSVVSGSEPQMIEQKPVLIEFLASHPALSQPIATQLAQSFHCRTMEKGIRMVSQGQLWDTAFFISSGIMRFYYATADGKEFNKGFYKEGDLVWPKAPAARTQPSLFTIECLTPCLFWQMSFADFQAQLVSEGLWERFALPYLEQFADEKFLREYEFLVHDAEKKYLSLCEQLGPMIERIPDYHLASYLGITNVALSRVKRKLKDA